MCQGRTGEDEILQTRIMRRSVQVSAEGKKSSSVDAKDADQKKTIPDAEDFRKADYPEQAVQPAQKKIFGGASEMPVWSGWVQPGGDRSSPHAGPG